MLKCESKKYNICGVCICESDAQQLSGDNICCDIAENCSYQKDEILKQCQYAKSDKKTE